MFIHMKHKEQSDHDTLLLLVQQVGFLSEEVKKMSSSLDNLKMAFPTRAEFDQVKIVVMGVANDGGLVKRMDRVERKFVYYAGISFIIGLLAIGVWQYFLATR